MEELNNSSRNIIQLQRFFSEVADVLSFTQSNEQSLLLRVPKASIFVEVDYATLREIIVILINQAFKSTESGAVILSADCTNDSDMSMISLIISVQDTGIGLTKEERRVLCEQLKSTKYDVMSPFNFSTKLIVLS
jgi:signal transduction histidine kinase